MYARRASPSCAAGVAVAFVHELSKCRAHGATRRLSPSKAPIQLSLRFKTNVRLWFTFFHEAGHKGSVRPAFSRLRESWGLHQESSWVAPA